MKKILKNAFVGYQWSFLAFYIAIVDVSENYFKNLFQKIYPKIQNLFQKTTFYQARKNMCHLRTNETKNS